LRDNAVNWLGLSGMNNSLRINWIQTFSSISLFFLVSLNFVSTLAQSDSNAQAQPADEQLNALVNQAMEAEDTVTRQNLLAQVQDIIERQSRTELAGYHDGAIQFPATPLTVNSVFDNEAIVYSVALPERLLHLVLADSVIQLYEVNIARDRLQRAVRYFGDELQISTSFGGMDRASIELYGWLVEPYVVDLRSHAIEKIIFVSSPTIRSLPMAALFDGERYLIDEFALATFLGLSQTHSEATEVSDMGAMAMQIEAFNQKADQGVLLSQFQDDIVLSVGGYFSSDAGVVLHLNSAYLTIGVATSMVKMWPIDDEAHAIIVDVFTSRLNAGLNKIESLRFALLALKSTPRFSHPYYWGSFRLVGNWH